MNCRSTTASTLLTVALFISLLALDHPVVHALHVKESTIPTGDSSSTNEGLQQWSRKLDVGKTKQVENVGVKASKGQASFGSSFRNGGRSGVESAKMVVVARRGGGPVPHPKKHN
ncbi:uncharacterized protein LOC100843894 isoform X2 [Brachypodium distachyon]|uniref:Uncharacterized protein n=1 Tax=Brachypodium distachyon TaxID=15368 RepID=I1IAZ0_BRADI|nr:uncharacterized protein LOC100843894 isoform X2 [Brachypodium distachyon]KQK00061.1 hypothetical protein BRADI_3g47080v3 [Brachypodium distachyon]|eukprot:XP_003575239.1 uncharacterized protein LOC100843894 isoform X2 [Brachypodium distachyon]